jgi:hypothetical protein
MNQETTSRRKTSRVTSFCAALFAVACGGDRSRSPTCGLAQIAGPALIQQQLTLAAFVLPDAPRGLPDRLPARVIDIQSLQPQSDVQVSYRQDRLALAYQGANFPPRDVGYGLLVVDDSTQRAQGVLIYQSQRPPSSYAEIGQVVAADRSIPLYGVRVDWPSVSNPRCPLLGTPTPPPQ